MLLAIDTSTSWASLALLDGFAVCSSHEWNVGQRHSVELFPALDQLLNTPAPAEKPERIAAIAVATGPGSFNGTRVAVTVAKTLAFVWQVPLVGVPTLHGIAQAYALSLDEGMSQIERRASILALLEAGRDELYTCWYDLDVRSVPERATPSVFARPLGEITINKVDEIGAPASTSSNVIVAVGEMSDAHADALQQGLGRRVQIMRWPGDMLIARAEGVGMLAQARLQAGERDDPLALEPLYVRRPNITTSTRHPIPGPSN